MEKGIIKTLQERDGLTEEQARLEKEQVQQNFDEAIANGEFDKAHYVMDDLELEPDFVEELM